MFARKPCREVAVCRCLGKCLLCVCLLWAVVPCRAVRKSFDLEKDFARLDSVVREVDVFMEARQKTLTESRRTASLASDADRYAFYKRMFDAYVKFCSDSALVYVQLCRETAERAGMVKEQMLADADLLYITALQGNLFLADRLARSMKPIEDYPPELRQRVAVALLEYNSRVSMFVADTSGSNLMAKFYTISDVDVWEKYSRYLPADSWLKDYYEGLFTNTDLRERISARLDGVARPSIPAAMLYVILAKNSMVYGTEDESCHYLILSAINDLMSANRETAALPMLLYTRYLDKNSARAANYAVACVKIANGYKDIARSFDIVKANSIIIADYLKMQHQARRNAVVIIVLLVVLVVLAGVLAYVFIRRARHRKLELDRAMDYNSRLRDALAGLTETKEHIESASAYRNALTLDAYVQMSDYINGVQKFCKSAANMIGAGQPEKARKTLQEGCSAPFLAAFYASFDKWFLAVRPDFPERFGQLLRPECRDKVLPQSGGLSPELRIYALVTLGITDSVSIAGFLHYSPQTIYNYRLRVRRYADIPEKDFAATVAALYACQQKSE